MASLAVRSGTTVKEQGIPAAGWSCGEVGGKSNIGAALLLRWIELGACSAEGIFVEAPYGAVPELRHVDQTSAGGVVRAPFECIRDCWAALRAGSPDKEAPPAREEKALFDQLLRNLG